MSREQLSYEDRVYPDHIYDPIRREILQMLLEKEFLKLFPELDTDDRAKMRANTEGWFKGEGYELVPAQSFWDAAEGMLDGFKLKHIVRSLTAENISWRREEVSVNSLSLVTYMSGLQAAGEPPYSAETLRSLFQDPEVRQRQLADDEAHSKPARDHYPIIVVRKGEKLSLLDGNRRLRRAILHDRPTLPAYVGSYQNEPFQPHNYWVSTPTIRNLLFVLNETPKAAQPHVEAAVRTVLHQWFAVSSIARVNFGRATSTKFQNYQFLGETDAPAEQ